MATFVLLHGAFHGSWCWERLAPLLQAGGHRVFTPDLPQPDGGREATPKDCLDLWAGAVAQLLRGLNGSAFLVGHSRSGIIASQVAELVPEKVAGLIYLAAFLVKDGETMGALCARLKDGSPGLRISRDPDNGRLIADPDSVIATIYNRSSGDDRDLIAPGLRSECASGFAIAPQLSADRFGRVPRAYVECLDDRIVPVSLQRGMHRSMGCGDVMTIDSDHAPYFSAPQQLAAILMRHVTEAR